MSSCRFLRQFWFKGSMHFDRYRRSSICSPLHSQRIFWVLRLRCSRPWTVSARLNESSVEILEASVEILEACVQHTGVQAFGKFHDNTGIRGLKPRTGPHGGTVAICPAQRWDRLLSIRMSNEEVLSCCTCV